MNKNKIKILIGLIIASMSVVVVKAIEPYAVTVYNDMYQLTKIGGTGLPIDIFEIPRSLFRYLFVWFGDILGNNFFLGIILTTILFKLLLWKFENVPTIPSENKNAGINVQNDLKEINEKITTYISKNKDLDERTKQALQFNYTNAARKKYMAKMNAAANGISGTGFLVTLIGFSVFYQALYHAGTGFQNIVQALPETNAIYFGILDLRTTQNIGIAIIMIILAIIQALLSAKIQSQYMSEAQVKQQKSIAIPLSIFQGVFGFILPAAMGIYFITSSCFTLIKILIKNRKSLIKIK